MRKSTEVESNLGTETSQAGLTEEDEHSLSSLLLFICQTKCLSALLNSIQSHSGLKLSQVHQSFAACTTLQQAAQSTKDTFKTWKLGFI